MVDESAAKQPLQDNGCVRGTSDLAQLIRSHHWHSTPIGPLQEWSETLCAMVNLTLSSPVPTAVCWGSSLVLIYNEAYMTILGGKHPQALGSLAPETWSEIWDVVGEDYVAILQTGLPRLAEGVLIPIELNGRLQDVYWNYVMTPIWERGVVAGVLTTCQDITDQVMTTNALVESDERLRLALSAGDCIGTWDWHIQTDRLFFERRFAAAFGADPDLANHGVPLSDFLEHIYIQDRVAVEVAIVRAVESGEEYLMEYRLMQSDGSARWVEAKGRCIYADNGLPLRFPGILFDISTRKGARTSAPEDRKMVKTNPAMAMLDALQKDPSDDELLPPSARRAQVIQALEELLTATHKSEHDLEGVRRRPRVETIFALLSEGLLLEQHFASAQTVPLTQLATIADRHEIERAGSRRLYLVDAAEGDSERNIHLANLLYAVWTLLGETLATLGIRPSMIDGLRPR